LEFVPTAVLVCWSVFVSCRTRFVNVEDQIFKVRANGCTTQIGVLGRGAHGIVYKGIDKLSGQVVAVKVYEEKNFFEEPACLLQMVRSRFVLKAIFISVDVESGLRFMVFPLCRPLSQRLQEQDLRMICSRMLAAIRDLQKRSRIHLDIKPDNILVHPVLGPVLADFSCSWNTVNGISSCANGDGRYQAPEVRDMLDHNLNGFNGEKCDMYSLGVTMRELCDANGYPSQRFRRLVEMMTSQDPANRPSMEQALDMVFDE
jgi:serine/threonine protein kinase